MEEYREQFENIYEEQNDAIYRFCLYKTSNTDQAEDLMQEAFVRLWNSMLTGKEILNMKAFLYQIARNLITDFYRKKKTTSLDQLQNQGFEASSDDHEQIENRIEIEFMVKIIEKLDQKYRDVVYLKLVEEMNIEEIAQSLEITRNNVTVRYHRGMKHLKSLIKNKEISN